MEMEERREQIVGEIVGLKSLLRDTDYEVTKYAEGLTDCTTQKEIEAYRKQFMVQYGDTIEERKSWRARINVLEEELAVVEEEIAEAQAAAALAEAEAEAAALAEAMALLEEEEAEEEYTETETNPVEDSGLE